MSGIPDKNKYSRWGAGAAQYRAGRLLDRIGRRMFVDRDLAMHVLGVVGRKCGISDPDFYRVLHCLDLLSFNHSIGDLGTAHGAFTPIEFESDGSIVKKRHLCQNCLKLAPAPPEPPGWYAQLASSRLYWGIGDQPVFLDEPCQQCQETRRVLIDPRELLRREVRVADLRGWGYYVYALVDSRNNEVFYIGKGKGDRAAAHLAEHLKGLGKNKVKDSRIGAILSAGGHVRIVLLAFFDSEKDAYDYEASSIRLLASTLTNATGRGGLGVELVQAGDTPK
jgi:hypothetical protein